MTAVANKSFTLESLQKISTANLDQSPNFSPAFQLMQAQMLITKNYDDQIRDVSEKIKFMKKVVGQYRDNLATVQKFLAQPTHDGKNKKQIIDATATQMQELCSALTLLNYNLSAKTITPKGIDLFDMEGRNSVNTDQSTWDGKTNTLDIKTEFEAMIAASTPEDYKAIAQKFSDKGTMQLFFSFSEKIYNNTNRKEAGDGARGLAVFDVYVEQLSNLTKTIEAGLSECETEVEELSNKLTDLTEKRKTSLELANQAVRKLNETNSNTVGKM